MVPHILMVNSEYDRDISNIYKINAFVTLGKIMMSVLKFVITDNNIGNGMVNRDLE